MANSKTQGERRAEICADTNFNANLHPSLVGWEIAYPTAENGGRDQQIAVADLVVARPSDDPFALRLLHGPTQATVTPLDLGFLTLKRRPPLFQLLTRFGPPPGLNVALPETFAVASERDDDIAKDASVQGSVTANDGASAARIQYRPRITYEGVVVLARRRWLIPSVLFPRRSASEAEAAYFLRIHRWRDEYGLPMDVFARVRPMAVSAPPTSATMDGSAPAIGSDKPDRHSDAEFNGANLSDNEASPRQGDRDVLPAGSATVRRRVSRDWAKPQYINFCSPLLVKLFARLPGSLVEVAVILEECLPTPAMLSRADDGLSYATKCYCRLRSRQVTGKYRRHQPRRH